MFPNVCKKSWTLICHSIFESHDHWVKKYNPIDEVTTVVARICELDQPIEIGELVVGFPYLANFAKWSPAELDCRPSYLLLDDIFSDFLLVKDDDEWANYIAFRLYIDRDRKEEVLREFRLFRRHLKKRRELSDLFG